MEVEMTDPRLYRHRIDVEMMVYMSNRRRMDIRTTSTTFNTASQFYANQSKGNIGLGSNAAPRPNLVLY